MATVTKWTPFGVALNITATGGTVTRISATQFTVKINASWETYYSGALTKYGMTASSGGSSVTLKTFSNTAASSGSGSFTGTYSISGNGSATKTVTVTFRNFNDDNGDSATKSVSFNVTVPAWTSYKITFNANGGTGAPGVQTKWHGQTLVLPTTKPTRTGYSFLGWSTSSTATTATYSAGGNYTANAAITLYAVWKANTYVVKYNANGGEGAPGNQTKIYGTTLKLSSTTPTRSKYNFLGWGTSASATKATYAAGADYTANAAITLYAVWEVAYQNPTLVNVTIDRCDSDGVISDSGTYGLVSFDWTTWENASSVKIDWTPTNGTTSSTTQSISGTGGYSEFIFGDGNLSVETSYAVVATLYDAGGSSSVKRTITGLKLPIDVLSGKRGLGVAIGKPSEKDGVFEVGLNNEFLGTTMQIGNRFAYSTTGVSGQAGYIKMVSVELVNINGNWPITFVFNRRRTPTPTSVHLTFDTVTDSDSTLSSFVYEGSDMAVYLVQSQPLVWDIYVQKANENDTITLQDWYTSTNMDKRIRLSFPGDILDSIPSEAIRCTPAHLRSILDFIYPVNSIYISWDHISPDTKFGGTWVRIENAFLWGCDEKGGIGTTGGEKTHKLTTAELPSHSHGAVYSGNASGTKTLPWLSTGVLGTGDKLAYSTIATGDSAAHNNMPPYVQVSIWRRTA